jgi:DNA modification methylase
MTRYLTREEMENKIFLGKATEVVDQFHKGTVDVVISSVPSEVGALSVVPSVLVKLESVLKQDGTIWIEVEDRYYDGISVGVPYRIVDEVLGYGLYDLISSQFLYYKRPIKNNCAVTCSNLYGRFLLGFCKQDQYENTAYYSISKIKREIETLSWGKRNHKGKWDFSSMNRAYAETLVWDTTRVGDLVLDPFCGVGVVLRAAKESNRIYTGIDAVPQAIKMAEELLNESG